MTSRYAKSHVINGSFFASPRKRNYLRYVASVGCRQRRRQWDAVSVGEHVTLRAGFVAIRGIRASLRPQQPPVRTYCPRRPVTSRFARRPPTVGATHSECSPMRQTRTQGRFGPPHRFPTGSCECWSPFPMSQGRPAPVASVSRKGVPALKSRIWALIGPAHIGLFCETASSKACCAVFTASANRPVSA